MAAERESTAREVLMMGAMMNRCTQTMPVVECVSSGYACLVLFCVEVECMYAGKGGTEREGGREEKRKECMYGKGGSPVEECVCVLKECGELLNSLAVLAAVVEERERWIMHEREKSSEPRGMHGKWGH